MFVFAVVLMVLFTRFPNGVLGAMTSSRNRYHVLELLCWITKIRVRMEGQRQRQRQRHMEGNPPVRRPFRRYVPVIAHRPFYRFAGRQGPFNVDRNRNHWEARQRFEGQWQRQHGALRANYRFRRNFGYANRRRLDEQYARDMREHVQRAIPGDDELQGLELDEYYEHDSAAA